MFYVLYVYFRQVLYTPTADGGFRGGNQQNGPTTSDMPEPFTDPSGDGMEWLCKPAASEDNVCGWFTGCQSGPSKVLTLLTHRAARDAESKNRASQSHAQRFEVLHLRRALHCGALAGV